MEFRKIYNIEVTKRGIIRNYKTKKISTQYEKKDGYLIVHIRINNKWTTRGVHQLVALAWIGPCPYKYEVNHKDLNKKNNYYKNLEYKTSSENKKHAISHGVKYVPRGKHINWVKLNKKLVKEIQRLYDTNAIKNLSKLAKKFNISYTRTYNIVNRRATYS